MEGLAIGSVPLDVLCNGRDPDSVEAHVLDIVELVDDTLVGAATVLAVRGVARRAGAVGGRKAIRDQLQRTRRVSTRIYALRKEDTHLVNGPVLPVRRRSGVHGGEGQETGDDDCRGAHDVRVSSTGNTGRGGRGGRRKERGLEDRFEGCLGGGRKNEKGNAANDVRTRVRKQEVQASRTADGGTGPSRTLQGFSARDEGENVEGGNKQRQTLTAHPSRSTSPVDAMPKLAAGELPSFLPLLAGLCLFLAALAWQTRPSRPLVSECSSASLSDTSPSAVRAAPPTAALHARAVHSRDP